MGEEAEQRRERLPLISIGMPVFNGMDSVGHALESILSQSFCGFELVISDNASTDRTEEICRYFSEKDSRVRYIRQPENIGAEKNFLFVLDAAKAPYFMWAAADDVRCPEFIEKNFEFLTNHGDCVASTMPTRFFGGKFDPLKMGDRPLLSPSAARRMLDFFSGWHANGLFYSLFRIDALRKCPWLGCRFLGSDWAVVLYLATQGKLNRLDCGWVELGRDGVSNSGHIFSRYRQSWIEYFFPFWRLTKAVFQMSTGCALSARIKLLYHCLKMNLWAVSTQLNGALYRHYKLLMRRSSAQN